ncbi:amino acid ABC transporter substrate-binding protein [Pseudomonas oryzihabitans]|nr:amino acid ABC transporter substrate-binding protein [Pseudomonas psychrotolerans]KTT23558.1 amino acid ABC transporter substrate-binding protein [Pseudomonas psychrotolerans]KTT58528.1 amino acid ABC transporter substrate-binding protein [Pseudomonas psychrotolerans]
MRKSGWGVAGVLLGCMLSLAQARAELPADYRVVLFTENFPPYNMAVDGKNFARDASIEGISTDLVREMFKRAKLSYDLSLRFPWERIYNLTLENANYGIFSTTRTPEREALFKWVGPLAPTSWVVLAPQNSTITLAGIKDLAKYRVGAYQNDAVSRYLESEGLAPINALRDQENVAKLQNGQLDLWATTDPVGRYLAKQAGVTQLKTVLRLREASLYLALNKDTPDEVVTRLQQALDAMRKEGVVDGITKRYL